MFGHVAPARSPRAPTRSRPYAGPAWAVTRPTRPWVGLSSSPEPNSPIVSAPSLIPLRTRLLLDACVGAPHHRARAWEGWLALTGFDRIDPGSHALLPSVAYLNRDASLAEEGRLRGVFRHNWAVNQRRFSLVLPALIALRDAALQPVLIKGAALVGPRYGSPGARRMADIDVLVRGDGFPAAAEVLGLAGFAPEADLRWPQASVKSRAFVGSEGTQIDLHVRPLQAPWDAAAEEVMRRRPGQVSILDHTFDILSDSASLVIALVHGMQYDGRSSHVWVLDAALLVRSGAVDWVQVADISRRLHLEYSVSVGLRALLPWVPAGSIPASALEVGPRPLEWIEQSFRLREPGGVLGALPNLYFLFRRERAIGAWSAGFAAYLRDAWDVPSEIRLSAVLVRKTVRRARSILPVSSRPAP